MASFKFSALVALQNLPLIPREHFAEGGIAYHLKCCKDKISPLHFTFGRGEKGDEHQGLVCQVLKIYLRTEVGLLL